MRLFTSDWIIERAVKFKKFPTFEDDTKILVFYIRIDEMGELVSDLADFPLPPAIT